MGTPTPTTVSTRLRRIATLAREMPGVALRTLAHHIDVELLREAFKRTRKDGATGVDRQTAAEYAKELERNLQSLLDRFKSGSYRAPPLRRVHIPKGAGSKTRPIGIPTFEDKVLQRAVAMVLEPDYEQDFLDCSYGFRPRRSAHQALSTLWEGLTKMRGGWVLEVDIKGFFDALDHSQLRSFLDLRVRDGVVRRTINKWLKAGVLEEGRVLRSTKGTPQGGVISPLLANVFLHEVLDLWFRDVVQPRLKGSSFMVRYADDFVIVFEREEDARRVFDVLPKRFGKYGLTLHPEKTRLVPFQRPRHDAGGPGEDGPQSFDLLGFTHHWARSRKGYWIVKRRTSPSRFSRAVKAIREWCRRYRHLPVREQQVKLNRKLRGHCAYYGITGNASALSRFRYELIRAWRKWLNRRSQRARMTWERFSNLLERHPIMPARAVHSVLRT